jgi:hypothetical protein
MRLKLQVGVLVVAVVSLIAVGAAVALPLTQSQPYQAVCEAQGGTTFAVFSDSSLYCEKLGAYLTAFTETQLDVQRTLCERVYGGVFIVGGQIEPNLTYTICSPR